MRPRLASAAYARATHLRSTQCGCVTPRGTPFCSKIDDGARASLSSSPDTVEPPQAACGEPQQPCYEYRRPGLLSSSMIDLRSDARSRAEEQERARRALVSKHVGQSREGERDVPERPAAILGDSLDRREPTVVVRAPTCVTACDQTCLRDPRHLTLSIASTRLGMGDCRASWRGVPVFRIAGGTFRLLQQPRVTTCSCA